jgi:hypothetical protein
MPVIVSAPNIALMIASSVACAVASNRGEISSFGSISIRATPTALPASEFAVENAMKMSPELLPEVPPVLANP